MATKTKLATISILTTDRKLYSKDVNDLLTDHGHLVMARLGVNVHKACIEGCTALISLAVEGSTKEITELTKKLNKIKGVIAKATVLTK
jgi:putative iron-only hydrogenase system regulator